MKLHELELKYGTKSCTLEEYLLYQENPQNCPNLGSVATIVYYKREVDKVNLALIEERDKSLLFPTVDQVAEIYWENPTIMIFIKLLILFQATEDYEFNETIVDILKEEDSDTRYDDFINYIDKHLGVEW